MSVVDNHSPSIDVGKKIKALREERRMSIRDVSRRSGISANAMSMIERGVTSPSLSTLYRLVEALGVPITALFREEDTKENIVFRRAGERSHVPIKKGMWEGLGGEDFVGSLQPFMLTLASGGKSGAQHITHSGHEFVMCLEGSLDYRVEEHDYLLKPGDSLLFAARLQHSWSNTDRDLCRAIIVLCGYGEYESPLEFHLPRK